MSTSKPSTKTKETAKKATKTTTTTKAKAAIKPKEKAVVAPKKEVKEVVAPIIENRISLEELSNQYATDKNNSYHGYLDIYQRYFDPFRDSLSTFMEIGVWKGDSLRMWRDYFTAGSLVGVDVSEIPSVELRDTQILLADQSDRAQLSAVLDNTFSEFDIIIDDGGHTMQQQQVTLGHLFKNLKSGGVFVIEDLHTSGIGAYMSPGDVPTLEMLHRFNETGKMESTYMTPEEAQYLQDNIKSLNVEEGLVSPIAFIIKK